MKPQDADALTPLPYWVQALGVVSFVGSTILAARLIWEQTVWTWQRGPQLVGFMLWHSYGAILFLFPVLLVLWMAVTTMVTLWNFARRNRVGVGRWAALGAGVLLLLLIQAPEGFWQRLFISRMAASPHAPDLMVYAAANGDVDTVKAFVSRGVPVDAKDGNDWDTPLHAAALHSYLPTVRYVVSMRADVNALNREGDSPLELATQRGNDEVAKFLMEHGAKLIKGDEAQRQKASQEKIRELINRTNPR